MKLLAIGAEILLVVGPLIVIVLLVWIGMSLDRIATHLEYRK